MPETPNVNPESETPPEPLIAEPLTAEPVTPEPKGVSGQAAFWGSLPAAAFPASMPRSRTQLVVRASIAALMVAAGIAGQVAGAGFPSNAPAEMFMNFAVTVALVVGAIVLGVFAVLAIALPSVPVRAAQIGPLAIVALCLTALPAFVWLVSVPFMLLESASSGSVLRFMSLSAPAFWLGWLWVPGMVFGAVSLRRPHALSRVLGAVAVVLGLLLAASVIWAAAIYSAGLTE